MAVPIADPPGEICQAAVVEEDAAFWRRLISSGGPVFRGHFPDEP